MQLGEISLTIEIYEVRYRKAKNPDLSFLKDLPARITTSCEILGRVNGRAIIGVGAGENQANAAYGAWENLSNQIMDRAERRLKNHPMAKEIVRFNSEQL